jgi:F0F1-type ATP synthase assembly protein I
MLKAFKPYYFMKKTLLFSFGLIGQIGFSTAIPLVVLGLLGRYLDKKFQTSPYLFLVGLALATVIIYFIIREIVKKALAEYENINKKSE